MKYAIAYLARQGNEKIASGTFYASLKKAEAEAKKLNDAVKVKGNGRYVVIEL